MSFLPSGDKAGGGGVCHNCRQKRRCVQECCSLPAPPPPCPPPSATCPASQQVAVQAACGCVCARCHVQQEAMPVFLPLLFLLFPCAVRGGRGGGRLQELLASSPRCHACRHALFGMGGNREGGRWEWLFAQFRECHACPATPYVTLHHAILFLSRPACRPACLKACLF